MKASWRKIETVSAAWHGVVANISGEEKASYHQSGWWRRNRRKTSEKAEENQCGNHINNQSGGDGA